MGFDLYPKQQPEYTINVDIWEWARFVILQLWAEGKNGLEETKRLLMHISMIHNKSLAIQHDTPEEEFDLQEWEDKVKTKKVKLTRKKNNVVKIISNPDENGKEIYEGFFLPILDEYKEESEIERHVKAIACCVAIFQFMEDKLWEVRHATVLYGLFCNGTAFDVEKAERILSNMGLWIMSEDIIESMSEMMNLSLMDRKSLHEVFMEELAGEYIPDSFMQYMPRVFGILIDASDEYGGGLIID
jgi:hypothetical protein